MNAVNPWVPPAGLVPPPFYAPSARTGYSYMKPGVKLAQGSAPPSRIVVPFDVIVLAAREYQDQPDLSAYFVIRAPLRDGPMPSVENGRSFMQLRATSRTTCSPANACSSRAGRVATDPA